MTGNTEGRKEELMELASDCQFVISQVLIAPFRDP
jgi:hypothetical protein